MSLGVLKRIFILLLVFILPVILIGQVKAYDVPPSMMSDAVVLERRAETFRDQIGEMYQASNDARTRARIAYNGGLAIITNARERYEADISTLERSFLLLTEARDNANAASLMVDFYRDESISLSSRVPSLMIDLEFVDSEEEANEVIEELQLVVEDLQLNAETMEPELEVVERSAAEAERYLADMESRRESIVEEIVEEAVIEAQISEGFADVSSALSALNQFPGASPQVLLGRGVRVGTGIMGSVALIMFIYAGITWMIAGGNADRQKKAMKIMLWTALALAVILSSYAIVSYFLDSFG